MLILYGIPACDTVKKARQWLDAHKVNYTFHDYKKKGVSREKLEQWLAQLPWEKLVNRNGTTWRKLPDEQKLSVTDAESAASFLQENTSAIKRPLIENAEGQIVALGFSENDYGKIFC